MAAGPAGPSLTTAGLLPPPPPPRCRAAGRCRPCPWWGGGRSRGRAGRAPQSFRRSTAAGGGGKRGRLGRGQGGSHSQCLFIVTLRNCGALRSADVMLRSHAQARSTAQQAGRTILRRSTAAPGESSAGRTRMSNASGEPGGGRGGGGGSRLWHRSMHAGCDARAPLLPSETPTLAAAAPAPAASSPTVPPFP